MSESSDDCDREFDEHDLASRVSDIAAPTATAGWAPGGFDQIRVISPSLGRVSP